MKYHERHWPHDIGTALALCHVGFADLTLHLLYCKSDQVCIRLLEGRASRYQSVLVVMPWRFTPICPDAYPNCFATEVFHVDLTG